MGNRTGEIYQTMTPFEMASQLRAIHGFADGDQNTDLGLHREWLIYLKRKSPESNQWQHLWLTTYDNRFIEAILYVYAANKPLNPKARPATPTIHCMLYRTMDEIVEAIGKTYKETVNVPVKAKSS